jgi:hypothetical protein
MTSVAFNPMDSTLAWDELVAALRDELRESGGLIRLLNLAQRHPDWVPLFWR